MGLGFGLGFELGLGELREEIMKFGNIIPTGDKDEHGPFALSGFDPA